MLRWISSPRVIRENAAVPVKRGLHVLGEVARRAVELPPLTGDPETDARIIEIYYNTKDFD